MTKELMQQSLDALKIAIDYMAWTKSVHQQCDLAIAALESAISQPEQPPARTFDLQDELDRLQSSWDLQEGEMRDVKSVVIAALAQHAQTEQPPQRPHHDRHTR